MEAYDVPGDECSRRMFALDHTVPFVCNRYLDSPLYGPPMLPLCSAVALERQRRRGSNKFCKNRRRRREEMNKISVRLTGVSGTANEVA